MAIAFDAATNGGLVNPGTSLTFAHTCSGSNRMLIVAAFGNIVSDAITGATYGGVPMTQVNKSQVPGDRYLHLFALVAPATGTNNVVITASGSIAIGGEAASYTGVSQLIPVTSVERTGTTTPHTTTLSTVHPNSWTVLIAKNTGAQTMSASTNSTQRASANDMRMFDNNGAIAAAGSYSMTVAMTGSDSVASIMVALAPSDTRTVATPNDMAFFTENTIGQWENVTPAVAGYTDSVTISFWATVGGRAVDTAASLPVVCYGAHYVYLRSIGTSVRYRGRYSGGGQARESTGPDIGFNDRALHHVVYVYEYLGPTSANLHLYMDGVKTTVPQTVIPDTMQNSVGGMIGRSSIANTGVYGYVGKIQDVRVYHSALTDAEVSTIYTAGRVAPAAITPSIWFKMDEKTGTSLTDSSGNGNHGTISNPNWPRIDFHNMLPNTTFEFAPTFTAATTTTGRYVDGTAAGSLNNRAWRWITSFIGTGAVQYDTAEKYTGNYSIKVSTTSATSYAVAASSSSNRFIAMPARPNTTYKVSGWIKTNAISGSSRGAYIRMNQRNAVGISISALADTTYIGTTTGWTYYEVSGTTNAATRFLTVELTVSGQNGGTTDLIMDAWFDDIQLVEVPAARQLATRTAVRDFGIALEHTASTSRIEVPYTFPTDAFTIGFWYQSKNGSQPNDFIFEQAGSVYLARQSTNDIQAYAYMNAPNDFATPRRLRFRMFSYLGNTSSVNLNNDGLWHHRAYVFYVESNSAKCDEYQDGVKIGATHTVDYTGDTTTPSGNLRLGNGYAVLQSGKVSYDEWQIYNRKLSAVEILSLYRDGINPYTPNLEFKLNEGSGTTAIDTGSNATNGTITGASYTLNAPMKSRTLSS